MVRIPTEMILNKKTGAAFQYQFNNCLLKFDNVSNQFTTNPDYQFKTDTAHYNAIILNKDPKFLMSHKINSILMILLPLSQKGIRRI